MVAVFSGYAQKAGRQTRRFIRVASRYPLEREARQLMDELGWPEGDQLRVSEELGYVQFKAAALPGMAPKLARLRELGEKWIKEERRWVNDRHWPK